MIIIQFSIYSKFLYHLFIINLSNMITTLTTNYDNIKIILTARCKIELLIDDDNGKTMLSLKQTNLKNDYIKPLFICSPKDVTKNTIELMHNFRFNKNKEIDEIDDSRVSFQSLYYIVRLKENDKIIGSLEMCYGISEKDTIGFGLFIDRNFTSKNLGSEVLLAGINFLKRYSVIRKLRWDCNRNNARSINIAKKCGFIYNHNWQIERNVFVSTFYLTI